MKCFTIVKGSVSLIMWVLLMTLFLVSKKIIFHRKMKCFGELYGYPKKGAPPVITHKADQKVCF